jgi:hypothetical protein
MFSYQAKWIFPALLFITANLMSGCQSLSDQASAQKTSTPQERVADLQIVDCLLPGQMRMLGSRSYMTPRRPTRTNASDCRIRGGEYVAYDRADYKTALSVWMPEAESGDAEAQANVGEIFERGLGGSPNYVAAIFWYKKSAEQGNKKAQFNIGTLYEQGLGVKKNMTVALNWYRKAWGVPENELMFKSVYDDELEKQKKQLTSKLNRKNKQITILEKQLTSLSVLVKSQSTGQAEMESEIAELNLMVADLKKERDQAEIEVSQLPLPTVVRLRQPTPVADERGFSQEFSASSIVESGQSFGRYYALIIGNQSYQNIDDLVTPLNDVDRMSRVLEQRYGFTVIRLNDSNNIEIMDAINNLNNLLTEDDNLLIYYAGHGNRVKTGEFETGYWLPTNADAPPRDTLWIPNEFVTRHIARLQAKRVLVIADSCYAGMLSSAPGYLMLEKAKAPSKEYVQYKLPRRSRLLLASGGDRPVLDSGGGENSVFARSLFEVLENNDRLLTGPELFKSVRGRVINYAKQSNFDQTPEYKVIKGAGHEMGDFFFVPTSL